MIDVFPYELVVLALLALSSHFAWKDQVPNPRRFWTLLALVVISSSAWVGLLMARGWTTDFGSALWATTAASALVFALVSLKWQFAQKLAPLLVPYLGLLGVLGSLVRGLPHPMSDQAPLLWLDLHIAIALGVMALLTVSAVSALGVALQERFLKNKTHNYLSSLLPSVSDAEYLSGVLLAVVEVLLGIGLLSGMAIEYYETGHLLKLDHKTLLSMMAFVLIGVLFIGHRVCGVRGRVAARIVLTAYLLIMLASPGVKFVTQVLL